MTPIVEKIISGGQTGADRAGLDWALKHGVPHGGQCPKDRRAEDGCVPAIYQLQESYSRYYPPRTRWNVEHSDATLVFSKPDYGRGTELTVKYCFEAGKPCLVLTSDQPIAAAAVKLRKWLAERQPKVLNVAGSRASTAPDIYTFAIQVLEVVL